VKSNLEPRSGPRIFVGKLNKETTENDVKVLTTHLTTGISASNLVCQLIGCIYHCSIFGREPVIMRDHMEGCAAKGQHNCQ